MLIKYKERVWRFGRGVVVRTKRKEKINLLISLYSPWVMEWVVGGMYDGNIRRIEQ